MRTCMVFVREKGSEVDDSTEGACGMSEGQGRSANSSTGIVHMSIGHTRRCDAEEFSIVGESVMMGKSMHG